MKQADQLQTTESGLVCKSHGQYIGHMEPSGFVPMELRKYDTASKDDQQSANPLHSMRTRPLVIRSLPDIETIAVKCPAYQPDFHAGMIAAGAIYAPASQVYTISDHKIDLVYELADQYYSQRFVTWQKSGRQNTSQDR